MFDTTAGLPAAAARNKLPSNGTLDDARWILSRAVRYRCAMTQRGMLEGIFDGLELGWSWNIELLEVDTVALPVFLRGQQELSSLRGVVLDHLRRQRQKHEAFSNRQFVYFIARRPKLRLAQSRGAKLIGHEVELRVLKGGAWLPRKIRLPVLMRPNRDGVIAAPCDLRIAGDQLVFTFLDGGTATTTLFDYLAAADTDLSLQSTVEYVGVTLSPATRPSNLEHRGLLETVYHTNSEHEEIVLLFNTFHVRAAAATEQLTVMSSNSLLNQLQIRPEAEFIEKLFIDYFEPEQQRCVLVDERTRLRNLERELEKTGVRTIALTYEVDAASDIYRIGSRHVRASRAHRIRRELRASASPNV